MAVAAEVVVDTPKAPVAKKVSHVMEMHGDKREDNYYWIRDDDRKDSDVLAYLNEENAYTEALMEGACWSPCVLILYMHNMMPQRPSPDHCILYLKDCAVTCCACFWSPLHMYFLRDTFVEDQLLCCTFAPVRLLCYLFFLNLTSELGELPESSNQSVWTNVCPLPSCFLPYAVYVLRLSVLLAQSLRKLRKVDSNSYPVCIELPLSCDFTCKSRFRPLSLFLNFPNPNCMCFDLVCLLEVM
jgi:hypothetical protein